MTTNPFENLGGVFGSFAKDFSGFMPQDDPDLQLFTLQGQVNDLKQQEKELYVQIGKQVLVEDVGRFPEIENRLKLIWTNLTEAKAKLCEAQAKKDAKEAAKRAADDACTCPQCGNLNPEGVKFCQECGARLGLTKCSKCGAVLNPGSRFCGECGAKQEG